METVSRARAEASSIWREIEVFNEKEGETVIRVFELFECPAV